MREISDSRHTSAELRQVIAYVLDPTAMAGAMVSRLESGMLGFAKDMTEIDRRFPGFTSRLRRQLKKEVEGEISHQLPALRDQFEQIFKTRLTPEDIRIALEFQRNQVLSQLRESAFIKSLAGSDEDDASLSERLSARMSPEQHAVVSRFLGSPCGQKLTPLTRRMETLKYDWMQSIVSNVSRRIPLIGEEILRRHYHRSVRS